MKSPEEVYSMLQEAKAKYSQTNKMLDVKYGEFSWNENMKAKNMAELEIKVLRSILGSDEVRLNLANKG